MSLLNQGISFNNLVQKYGYGGEEGQNSSSNWIIEDNLNKEVKNIITKMEVGSISKEIKVDGGYKIFKLNKKDYLVIKCEILIYKNFIIKN